MRVIVKEPGKPCRAADVDGYAGLRELIGCTWLETHMVAPGVAMVCDEAGFQKGLTPNCCIRGIRFVGILAFTGVENNSYCDVPQNADWVETNLITEGG